MNFTRDFSKADRQKVMDLRNELRNRADGVVWTDADLHKLNDLLIYASKIMLDTNQIDAKTRESLLDIKPNDPSLQTKLTDTENGIFDWSFVPTATGDDSAIIFARREAATFHGQIWMMDIDGSNKRRIDNGKLHCNYPHLSPDADKIVFGSDPTVAYTGLLNNDLAPFVMNTDGTGVIDIAAQVPAKNKYGFGQFFRWSPDGQWILCYSERAGGFSKSDIYKFKIDGSQEIKLSAWEVDGYAHYPSWNTDGTKIIYDGERQGNVDEIYIMNADGTGKTMLTNNTATDMTSSVHPFQDKIAYSSRPLGVYHIFTMNTNGTNIQALTEGSFTNRDPEYTNDGTRIMFVSNRTGFYEVYIMPADGVPVNKEFRHEFMMSTQDTYHAAWAYDHSESYRLYVDTNMYDQDIIQEGRHDWTYRESDPAIVDRSLLRHGYREKREGEADPEDILGRYGIKFTGITSKFPNDALYPSDTLYPSEAG